MCLIWKWFPSILAPFSCSWVPKRAWKFSSSRVIRMISILLDRVKLVKKIALEWKTISIAGVTWDSSMEQAARDIMKWGYWCWFVWAKHIHSFKISIIWSSWNRVGLWWTASLIHLRFNRSRRSLVVYTLAAFCCVE